MTDKSISNEIQTEVLTQALPYIQRYRGKVVVVEYGADIFDSDTRNAFGHDVALLSLIGVKFVLVPNGGASANADEIRSAADSVNKAGGKALGILGSEAEPIRDTLSLDYTPIVGIQPGDEAARIAGELKAEIIIALSGVKGILEREGDDSSLLPEINVSDVPHLIRSGVISGDMAAKVREYVDAIRRGVKKAFIIDGRISHSILVEMFSDEGVGTMIR